MENTRRMFLLLALLLTSPVLVAKAETNDCFTSEELLDSKPTLVTRCEGAGKRSLSLDESFSAHSPNYRIATSPLAKFFSILGFSIKGSLSDLKVYSGFEDQKITFEGELVERSYRDSLSRQLLGKPIVTLDAISPFNLIDTGN